ncbi:MAG TPA: hypothetical protein EYH30_05850 [Anaerolineales bacterium]|nr:hypothetical protein [Anaerolineae bacterium]HIQ01636.1 hypothetical protein [Anaerolineales bacterium]
MKRWQKVLTGILALGVLLAASGWAVRRSPTLKEGVRTALRATGFEGVVMPVLERAGLATPPLPEYCLPIPPADRVSARRLVVAALHEALDRGDFEQAAQLNGILAQEAYQRAYRALQAWEPMRDPETGLVPFATHPRTARWEPEHAGADLYPFLLLASHFLEPDNEELWLEAMQAEREICGPMPCMIHFGPAQRVERDPSETVFGASEYAKDGLLALTERLGPGPWLARMEEVMDALLESSSVQTPAGPICSNEAEVNGEMLQVLSRLYWMTGEERYLDMAERIAEAYLFEVLPHTRYLPPTYWDFETEQPLHSEVRFQDHGSEIIPGLVELYLLEREMGRSQAARYREPLLRMLEAVLANGRTEGGLWYSIADLETGEPVDRGVVDTWGYILNGYQAFDLAEGTDTYAGEIEGVMRAVTAYRSFRWEGQLQDGYADTIESMLYLLPWFDIPEAHRWVDDEIEVMFAKQLSSGFVEAWYLDGNFIRTALLYGAYKTQGVTARPWRWDVQLGAAYAPAEEALYIYIGAETAWEGRLRFDEPRHRTIWNLPFEYPRLNGSPEWFVVEPEGTYQVVDLDMGASSTYSGQVLIEGLPVRLDGGDRTAVRLKVVEQ